jgi:dipeptidyl aminopeptidase/acylaminoacyl peptidase
VIYTWGHPQRGGDLWKVPLDGSSDPEALLATEYNEIIPQVSPDGKWLAFLSDQKGSYQIMVRPFEDMQRREWSASGGVGLDARWTPDGDALLFWRGWGNLMRVPVTTGDDFAVGVAHKLRDIEYHDAAGSSLAISPDGNRVLIQRPVEASLRDETPMILVTGWADEVARLLDASE